MDLEHIMLSEQVKAQRDEDQLFTHGEKIKVICTEVKSRIVE